MEKKKTATKVESVEMLVQSVMEILRKVATTDTPAKRRQTDAALKRILSRRKKRDVMITGKLASPAKIEQTVDIHITMPSGGTLSMGYASPSNKPAVFPKNGKEAKAAVLCMMGRPPFSIMEKGDPTITYYWTSTNCGLPDQQGDSRSDVEE